nr:MAG TPA: hypothetical protein [Bacteriophage sp.]
MQYVTINHERWDDQTPEAGNIAYSYKPPSYG